MVISHKPVYGSESKELVKVSIVNLCVMPNIFEENFDISLRKTAQLRYSQLSVNSYFGFFHTWTATIS